MVVELISVGTELLLGNMPVTSLKNAPCWVCRYIIRRR